MSKIFKLGDGDGIGMAEWKVRAPPPAVVGLPGGMRIKTPVRRKRNSGEFVGEGAKTPVRSKRSSGEYAGVEGRVRWAA